MMLSNSIQHEMNNELSFKFEESTDKTNWFDNVTSEEDYDSIDSVGSKRNISDSEDNDEPLHKKRRLDDNYKTLDSVIDNQLDHKKESFELLNEQKEDNLNLCLMNNIKQNELREAWLQYLKIQTNFLGESEIKWLKEFEIEKEQNIGILEIGSANGYYGSYLANQFSNIQLYGIEANEEFLHDIPLLPSNYTIQQCKLGCDPFPNQLKGVFKHIFIRFVLQHVSQPSIVLQELYNLLPNNGKLFIIEEDTSYFYNHSNFKPYDMITQAWKNICQLTGTDCNIGSKLPKLLKNNGFKVEYYKINLLTNIEYKNIFCHYMQYAGLILHLTKPDIFNEKDFNQAFEQFNDSDHVLTYPQILVVASKC